MRKRYRWLFDITIRTGGQDWIIPGWQRVARHRITAELMWIWLRYFSAHKWSVMRVQLFHKEPYA